MAGLVGGTVGAALVGTIETILRRRIERNVPNQVLTFHSTYTRKRDTK